MTNLNLSVLISKVLGALVLSGFVSSNVVASNPRETARTESVGDVVENIEVHTLDLNTSDFIEVHKEAMRILILFRQVKLALIKGERAEFDDLVTKIIVYATSYPDRFKDFQPAFAAILSLGIELGWSFSNESVLELYKVSTAPQSDQVSYLLYKISYAFAVGNLESLISSAEKLPPITEASNSWERFVRGLADYRHYLLSGEKAKLSSAITQFESISIDTSVVTSDGVADKPRLFDARVRLQLANAYLSLAKSTLSQVQALHCSTPDAYLSLAKSTLPQEKQVSLEQANTIWNAMAYPALIIDYPALWGAHMLLYAEILSMSLLVTDYKGSEKDDKRREVTYRRDEAYFLASRYR
jgi:hypothetical protein